MENIREKEEASAIYVAYLTHYYISFEKYDNDQNILKP
jgi:hypothetical protein